MKCSPWSVLKCNRTFVLRGTALACLERCSGRSLGNLRVLLLALGEHCFENFTDGVFTTQTVRRLPLDVQARTAVNAHLPLLVACGAVLALDDGSYAIAGYHEFNPAAAEFLDAIETRRAYWRAGKAMQRSRESAQFAQSVQTRPLKNAMISRVDEKCPHQPTEPTASERVRSEINNQRALASQVPEVDSPRKSQKQTQPSALTSIGKYVEAAMLKAKAHQAKRNAEIGQITEDELAIADELSGKGAAALSSRRAPEMATGRSNGAQSSKGTDRLPTRPPARMPNSRTPLNQHVVETEMQKLEGRIPSSSRRDAFFTHLNAIGITQEELGYCTYEFERQKKVLRISNPINWALAVVTNQKRLSLEIAT